MWLCYILPKDIWKISNIFMISSHLPHMRVYLWIKQLSKEQKQLFKYKHTNKLTLFMQKVCIMVDLRGLNPQQLDRKFRNGIFKPDIINWEWHFRKKILFDFLWTTLIFKWIHSYINMDIYKNVLKYICTCPTSCSRKNVANRLRVQQQLQQ